MGEPPVSASDTQGITLSLTTLDQLFNDPQVNPFSEKEVEVRGESGMSYLLHELQGRRRDGQDLRLTVLLPPDQITADLQPSLSQAIHRYCQARIESNMLDIHLIRARSSTGLGILLAIVVILIAAAYLLLTQVAPDAPPAIQAVIVSTICLFAWVSLWDPLEALLFNPLVPMRENRLLRRILDMNVQVESATSATRMPTTRPSGTSAQTLPAET